MSEEREAKTGNSSRNWAIASIACGFLGSWLFSQYGESVLGAFFPTVAFLWPVALVALGIFAGWQLKKWRTSLLLGMTIEEAASRLGARIDKRSFDGLSDECMALLLMAYESPDCFAEPPRCFLYENPHQCLQILRSRGLVTILPSISERERAMWAARRAAREYLDAHQDVLDGIKAGAARNDEQGDARRTDELLIAWRKASRIHRLITYLACLEDDSDEGSYFPEAPSYELHYSELVKEIHDAEMGYIYIPRYGTCELFEAHPALLDELEIPDATDEKIYSDILALMNEDDED